VLAGAFGLDRQEGQERHLIEAFRSAGWRSARLMPIAGHGFLAVGATPRTGRTRPAPVGRGSLFADRHGATAVCGFVYPPEAHGARAGGSGGAARVLHRSYRTRGLDAPAALEGQFAVAGFDVERQRLWLAVDTFGAAELFHALRGRVLYFCTDLPRLLGWTGIPAVPCPQALHGYLTQLQVPPPLTGFRGVQALVPNSVLWLEEGTLRSREDLWQPAVTRLGTRATDVIDALGVCLRERAAQIARAAGRARPAALLFSGGIDSTLLAAALGAGSCPVVAHGLGAAGSEELATARRRAAGLGMRFRGWPFRPEELDRPTAIIRKAARPVFAFPAMYVEWFVSRVSRTAEHLVSGSGADALFLRSSGARSDRPLDRFLRRFLYTEAFVRALEPIATPARHAAAGGATSASLLRRLSDARSSIVSLHTWAAGGRAAVHFPFLSKTVIDLAAAAPAGPNGDKPLLRALLQRSVPHLPVMEPKRGFGHSIRIEEHGRQVLRRAVEDVRASGLHESGFLRRQPVEDIVAACRESGTAASVLHLAWGLVALAIWFRLFFAGPAAVRP
jgi:asparagine synthetase B (glutamine-hydrolysing)